VGIYRLKKNGKSYGPYKVKVPYRKDFQTGKILYTTITAGYDKNDALAVFKKKMTEWKRKLLLGSNADATFSTLADDYCKRPTVKNLRTFAKIEQHCKTLKNYFGQMKARDIKPSLVEEYREMRLNTKSSHGRLYKPASINREVEVLKRIFNLALRDELVEKNPCWKVERLCEDNVRTRVLLADEFRSLVAALPQYAADIVTVGYFTGMRFGEIINLTWDRVNLKENYFVLRAEDTKTRKSRNVFYPSEVRQIIDRIRKDIPAGLPYVFLYRGNPIKSIRKSFSKASSETKIENLRFHDLRRTFVTNMRRAGAYQSVIMQLSGHRTPAMFARYDCVGPDDAKKALKELDNLLGKEDDTASNMP
jgi:integrase